MGEHDFNVRVTQGEEFLKEGNQLKISLPFRGREITHKEFGYEMINKAIKRLESSGKTVKAPYLEGKVLVSMLAPAKG
jgi:translation initiation factor IF-3